MYNIGKVWKQVLCNNFFGYWLIDYIFHIMSFKNVTLTCMYANLVFTSYLRCRLQSYLVVKESWFVLFRCTYNMPRPKKVVLNSCFSLLLFYQTVFNATLSTSLKNIIHFLIISVSTLNSHILTVGNKTKTVKNYRQSVFNKDSS